MVTRRVFFVGLLTLAMLIAGCGQDSTGDNNANNGESDTGTQDVGTDDEQDSATTDATQDSTTEDTADEDATGNEQLATRWIVPESVDKLEWEGGLSFCYESDTEPCEYTGVGSGSLPGGETSEYRTSWDDQVVTGVTLDIEVTAGSGTLEVWRGRGGYFDFDGEIIKTYELEAGNTYTDTVLLD